MIIVNYYLSEDYNPKTDGFDLQLVAIVNDHFDLQYDVELLIDVIENDEGFKPEKDVLYQIHLVRATIDSDPVPEPTFAIHQVIPMYRNSDTGIHQMKLIRY